MNDKIDFSSYNSHMESPGLLLWQISSLWKRKINEILLPYNITHTQFVILSVTYFLTQRNKEKKKKNISSFSRIDTMTISIQLNYWKINLISLEEFQKLTLEQKLYH